MRGHSSTQAAADALQCGSDRKESLQEWQAEDACCALSLCNANAVTRCQAAPALAGDAGVWCDGATQAAAAAAAACLLLELVLRACCARHLNNAAGRLPQLLLLLLTTTR
jgi:hypothetical protein